ncbi:MAG: hypothetical protein ABSH21_03185 [Verrucomicrobiia bacterium]|jgi:hypothetical protein
MPAHDIIDNRKQKLVDHINRILSSTEAGRTRWGAITADAGQGLTGWSMRCTCLRRGYGRRAA